MKIYAGSISVAKPNGKGGIDTASKSKALQAVSYDEAMGTLYNLAREEFPTSEGWEAHVVTAVAVPQEWYEPK